MCDSGFLTGAELVTIRHQSGKFFDRCPLMRGKWDRVYAPGLL
jgi:hypothetical protein